MYGAIIGDLAGSIYEFEQSKKVSTVNVDKIIEDNAFYSDDTILTIAIADAILHDRNYERYLRYYIKEYSKYKPNFKPYFKTSFSPGLIKWANGEKEGNSIGNGAMMRISPVGFMFSTEEEVIKNARLATIPSHNSVEAIDCATTIALIIYYLKKGMSLKDVYVKMNLNPQFVSFKKFNTTCHETIDNCLYVLKESTSFEDAIRNIISIGGDTDTNACIVGSMAEELYGIPDEYISKVDEIIPEDFVKVLKKAYK